MAKFHWQDAPRWLRALAILATINFVVYVTVAITQGGEAWDGFAKDGRYFLFYKGRYTEVSHDFWIYSFCHTIFFVLLHVSTMVAGFSYWLYWLYRNRDVPSTNQEEQEQRF